MHARRFRPSGPLLGTIRVPGDKSISHRALMLSALAVGESRISDMLEGEDVLATAAALRAMGATIERDRMGDWLVHGVGVGGLLQPQAALEMGNSGTSTRLLMGLVASHAITATFTGDSSLSKRPMGRVTEPLSLMGAEITASPGGTLPLMIRGMCPAVPIEYTLPVPSAQVKSAVLLAGLNTPGETTVVEREATRDHSEIMLAHFGATVRRQETEEGLAITIVGQPDLVARDIEVPGDPSSAAFPVVAACIAGEAELVVEHVGVNPLRTGLYTTLQEMGAAIEWRNERLVAGEKVADLVVTGGRLLKGIEVPAERAPSMIDEYPILAIAAAQAQGTTVMHGLAELKVKESDRLAAIAAGLAANGVKVEVGADSLTVHGTGGRIEGGGTVQTHLDHRIAMSFLVMGIAARQPVTVDDVEMIDTSFPGFVSLMNGLGARIAPAP